MFNAPYCWCCGKKEHFNGYGCNNPECKEYYKLKERIKGAKDTEQTPSEEQGKIRSKTFPGIAKAMAEQWGG